MLHLGLSSLQLLLVLRLALLVLGDKVLQLLDLCLLGRLYLGGGSRRCRGIGNRDTVLVQERAGTHQQHRPSHTQGDQQSGQDCCVLLLHTVEYSGAR